MKSKKIQPHHTRYVQGRTLAYLPSDTFSPASGGRVKVRRAMDEMRTQGRMRLTP